MSIEPITPEEVLRINYQWFVVEKHPKSAIPRPIHGADKCLYRGQNGEKCAIGCVLPDELYRIEMDDDGDAGGMGVLNIIKKYEDVDDFFHMCSREFLSYLQGAHDGAKMDAETHIMHDYATRLSRVAKYYNLPDPTVTP